MRSLLILFALLGLHVASPAQATTRVLFLGNSYTAFNNLPALVQGLAAASGRTMIVAANTPGGNTLGSPQGAGQPHSQNATSLGLIASAPWDAVVLQEQSFTPTIAAAFQAWTIPGAQTLQAAITANDPATRTILYMTWGRRFGGQFCAGANCSPLFADFAAMQASLAQAYTTLAGVLGAEVAPVGLAWQDALLTDPSLVLHLADDSHPNLAGSYLAACTFFARLFDVSPVGLGYDAGLGAAPALALQQAAARAVFGPGCGFLPYGMPSAINRLGIMGSGPGTIGSAAAFGVSGLAMLPGPCIFAIADRAASTPAAQGLLLVDLQRLVLPLQTVAPTGGQASLSLQIPPLPQLAGRSLFVQAAILDPPQPQGISLSTGLELRICP